MENLSREELEARRRALQRSGMVSDRCRGGRADATTSTFALNRDKPRKARRREGRYLLRTNLCDEDPAKLWKLYIELVEIEAAFKNLKDDL
jgi:hypothetical protein